MRELAHQSLDMVFPELPPGQLIVVIPDRLPGSQPQLKLVHDHRRKVPKLGDVGLARGSRQRIEDTQGPQIEAIVGFERYPEIELDAGRPRHQGVGQGADVRLGVADNPGAILEDAGCAEARVAIDLRHVYAVP